MATSSSEMLEMENKEAKTAEDPPSDQQKPTCVVVLGMAGSGKTTFVQVSGSGEKLFHIELVILQISPIARHDLFICLQMVFISLSSAIHGIVNLTCD